MTRIELVTLRRELVQCRRCPRLVAWREKTASEKRAAFRSDEYWGRPVPGFGDPRAGVLVVGLAPAAHGANRTGRMFTGDRAGDWLYRAMHRAGFANQPLSRDRDDGLELSGAYVTAGVRCAPPKNRPTTAERDRCAPYLRRELELLWPGLHTVVALGGFAYGVILGVLGERGLAMPRPRPAFRARGGGGSGTGRGAGVVPPQPAEHLHREADRADVRRGVGPGGGAGGGAVTQREPGEAAA